MAQAGTDTRKRIEETALRLFTEKGYDSTSLREIAEELGVTKAALYYHFKSKEEILESIVSGLKGELQELIDWASALPKTLESRKTILERISSLAEDRWKPLIRFSQVNQVRMRSLGEDSGEARLALIRGLFSMVCEPGADRTARFRSALAVAGLFFGAAGMSAIFPGESSEDYAQVALETAFGLIS